MTEPSQSLVPLPCRDGRPTLHNTAEIESFRREWRLDPDRIRRMQFALYHLHESVRDSLARLGPAARAAAEWFDSEPLKCLENHDSEADGSTKFVLECQDNQRIEAVLIRATTARTTVCLSTQVGCGVGCPFCATGRMGLRRQLDAAEIVEQFLVLARAARSGGRRVRNVVFMGMGEPLDNFEPLCEAIGVLTEPQKCRVPFRRVTVSTVGPPEALRELTRRYPRVQIALSLHSAIPAVRAKLVPWSRKYDWDHVREALREVAAMPRLHREHAPPMIEYVMIDGVNDSVEDANALVNYLDGIHVSVNLIPLNPIRDLRNWRATPRGGRDRFAAILRQAGIFTTIRYSMGADVAGACGQLVQA